MKRLGYGVATLVVAIASSGAICSGGNKGGGSDTGDKAAAINFQLRKEFSDDFALKDYTVSVTWHGDLVDGIGSEGNANPFDITQSYSGKTDTQGDYVVKQLAQNERPGKWHFTVTADGWTGECTTDLPEGNITSVNFTYQKAGCLTGASFP